MHPLLQPAGSPCRASARWKNTEQKWKTSKDTTLREFESLPLATLTHVTDKTGRPGMLASLPDLSPAARPVASGATQFGGGSAASGFGTTWVEKKAGSGDYATVCLFGADPLPRSGTVMVEIIFKHTRASKHSLAD